MALEDFVNEDREFHSIKRKRLVSTFSTVLTSGLAGFFSVFNPYAEGFFLFSSFISGVSFFNYNNELTRKKNEVKIRQEEISFEPSQYYDLLWYDSSEELKRELRTAGLINASVFAYVGMRFLAEYLLK